MKTIGDKLMKLKIRAFNYTALCGAAVVFACLIGITPSAQAEDQLWIGTVDNTDPNVSTPSNWANENPVLNFTPVVFGSDVVGGTMQLNPWAPITTITTTSGLTMPVTILGSHILAGGTTVTMDAAGADLTIVAAMHTAWGNLSYNVGAGRTLTLNGALGESDGWNHADDVNPAALVKDGEGAAVITSAAYTTKSTATAAGYYTAGTFINAGTLQLGDGTEWHDGSLPSITTVNNSAALVYNLYGDQTAAYPISGTGTVTKTGNGTLAFSGFLGFTGGITVNGGTLQMPAGSWNLNAIASYPITVNAGATLQLPADPSAYNVAPTLNGGTIASSGVNISGWPNITLVPNCTLTAGGAAVSTISTWVGFSGNGTFSVGSGSTLNITGRLTGDWIEARTGLFKTDVGTLTLSNAANDYDCGTTINGGTLEIGGAGQLNSGNYGYNIINNGALVYGSSAAQMLSGAISGTGTLTQNAGTLTLSGANTYTNTTTVNGGTLTFGSVAAVGSTSQITVNAGGLLDFGSGTAGGTISTPISLTGGGWVTMQTSTPGSQVTFTGPITLSGGALIVAAADNPTINFTNAIHGAGGLVFAGPGGTKAFMILSGASDFSGDFSIINWNAAVQVTLNDGDNRLPTTAVVRVAGSTALPGALDLNGNNQTIAGLGEPGWGSTEADARHVVNTSGTAVTLTLNTTTDQSSGVTIGGTDINGTTGDNLALVKTGAATQTLTGVNTYTGLTAVSNGVLKVTQVLPTDTDVYIASASGAKLYLDFPATTTNTIRRLYVDGELQQRNRVYSIANRSQALDGTGLLYVTEGSGPGTLIIIR